MKKSILLLILLVAVSATTTFAQRKKKRKDEDRELTETLTKIFQTKVDMDFDSTIFDAREDNMYVSNQYKALLLTLVAKNRYQHGKLNVGVGRCKSFASGVDQPSVQRHQVFP